ncbi:hypothetical protein JB92DRAFT_994863 [Gautieria morchelliformis]|nr:hypothetical protein JB92DRAFT_994863 [Gautieria morchelliformis]
MRGRPDHDGDRESEAAADLDPDAEPDQDHDPGTPVLLEELLESDTDDAPFEHGPTEFPPRAYGAPVGHGHGGGGGGTSFGDAMGGGYNNNNNNNVGSGADMPRRAHGSGSGATALGVGLGVKGLGGYGYRGALRWGGRAFGGLKGGRGTAVTRAAIVHGRAKLVGTIPASELDFLPILEARFDALERAIARVVEMRGERAVQNSVLPSSGEANSGTMGVQEESKEDGLLRVAAKREDATGTMMM